MGSGELKSGPCLVSMFPVLESLCGAVTSRETFLFLYCPPFRGPATRSLSPLLCYRKNSKPHHLKAEFELSFHPNTEVSLWVKVPNSFGGLGQNPHPYHLQLPVAACIQRQCLDLRCPSRTGPFHLLLCLFAEQSKE